MSITLKGNYDPQTREAVLGYAPDAKRTPYKLWKRPTGGSWKDTGLTDNDGHAHLSHSGTAEYKLVDRKGVATSVVTITADSTPDLPETPAEPAPPVITYNAYDFDWTGKNISKPAAPAIAAMPSPSRSIQIKGGDAVPADVTNTKVEFERGKAFIITRSIEGKNFSIGAFGSGPDPLIFLKTAGLKNPSIINTSGDRVLIENVLLDSDSSKTVGIAADNRDITTRNVSGGRNINYLVKIAGTASRLHIEELNAKRLKGYGIYGSEGATDITIVEPNLRDCDDQTSLRLNGCKRVLVIGGLLRNVRPQDKSKFDDVDYNPTAASGKAKTWTKGGAQIRECEDVLFYKTKIWGQLDTGALESNWSKKPVRTKRIVYRDVDLTHCTQTKWSKGVESAHMIDGSKVVPHSNA